MDHVFELQIIYCSNSVIQFSSAIGQNKSNAACPQGGKQVIHSEFVEQYHEVDYLYTF